MKISIITCFHNSGARIAAYARALQGLDCSGFDVEVILVDNASKDATRENLKRLSADLSIPAQVVVEERPGLMYARCAGIAAAAGEYAVFFDDDNEPQSDYLQALRRLTARYPDAVAFTGNAVLPPEYAEQSRLGPALSLLAVRRERGEKDLPLVNFCPQPMVIGAGMIVHSALMRDACNAWMQGSRTIVGRTGDRPLGGEEIWLLHYMTKEGGRAVFSDSLTLVHRIEKGRFEEAYLCRLGYEYGFLQPQLAREIRRFKPGLRFSYPSGWRGLSVAALRVMVAVVRQLFRPSRGGAAITAHRCGMLIALMQDSKRE